MKVKNSKLKANEKGLKTYSTFMKVGRYGYENHPEFVAVLCELISQAYGSLTNRHPFIEHVNFDCIFENADEYPLGVVSSVLPGKRKILIPEKTVKKYIAEMSKCNFRDRDRLWEEIEIFAKGIEGYYNEIFNKCDNMTGSDYRELIRLILNDKIRQYRSEIRTVSKDYNDGLFSKSEGLQEKAKFFVIRSLPSEYDVFSKLLHTGKLQTEDNKWGIYAAFIKLDDHSWYDDDNDEEDKVIASIIDGNEEYLNSFLIFYSYYCKEVVTCVKRLFRKEAKEQYKVYLHNINKVEFQDLDELSNEFEAMSEYKWNDLPVMFMPILPEESMFMDETRDYRAGKKLVSRYAWQNRILNYFLNAKDEKGEKVDWNIKWVLAYYGDRYDYLLEKKDNYKDSIKKADVKFNQTIYRIVRDYKGQQLYVTELFIKNRKTHSNNIRLLSNFKADDLDYEKIMEKYNVSSRKNASEGRITHVKAENSLNLLV